MAFITKSDIEGSIRDYLLDQMTEFNDNHLDRAISYAVDFAKGYLNARYDVAEIFSKTGNDRSLLVLMKCIDVAIWNLHSLINPRKIPEFRQKKYDEAKEWFSMVQAGEINQPDLPVPATDEKDYVKFGSNPRRINHI